MYRFLGILAGATTSLVTGYLRARKRRLRRTRPRARLGVCDHQCRKEYHAKWTSLESHDPRSPNFLSSLERAWFEDLEPSEAIHAEKVPRLMERVMYDHAIFLLDGLVEHRQMEAHDAEHLKDYYRAMILRATLQY